MSTPDPRFPTGLEPGWYQDPEDPRRHRYWDGDSWQTECERLVGLGHEGACPGDGGD